ncbi:MAG: glycerol-3-phosphate 1-O-acyltransferase PlsY [Marinilabiliaceae bacterium]|jgi:glycerol-3-phosphate acyltransferase PlsY|nr:glycerol-3-phosphate 1-O-acyltransferase PlsY [Marinilabiliaceae bacterium]
MDIKMVLLTCLSAYALGSVTTSVWAGKIFHGVDVREHGSGNAGATNTIRVLGWWTGIPVLIIDIAKGWLAAILPVLFSIAEPGSPAEIQLQILAGIIAITGHIFPVFAGFRGGKGVATTFGVLLAISPFVTISCLVVFLVVLLITGYVSVSSMSAGISFPVFVFALYDSSPLVLNIFSVLIAVAILFTHRSNIRKLRKGEENRFIWKRRDKKN